MGMHDDVIERVVLGGTLEFDSVRLGSRQATWLPANQ
jgi:hypothetical protein